MKITTAATGGLALSNLGMAQSYFNEEKPLRIGFVGVGDRGSYHLDRFPQYERADQQQERNVYHAHDERHLEDLIAENGERAGVLEERHDAHPALDTDAGGQDHYDTEAKVQVAVFAMPHRGR